MKSHRYFNGLTLGFYLFITAIVVVQRYFIETIEIVINLIFFATETSTKMDDQQHSPPDYKRMSLDKIIEAMTADLDSGSRHGYNPFGSRNWADYTPSQMQHYMTNSTLHSNPSNVQPVNPISSPLFMPDIPPYDSSTTATTATTITGTGTTERIYFPAQTVNRLGINENNDLIGTIEQYNNKLNNITSYTSNQGIIDQEYSPIGLFHSQQSQVSESF